MLLPLKGTVLGTQMEVGGVKYSQSFSGHTKDISPIGISSFFPNAPFEDLDLAGEHRRLRIALEMPQPLEMYVTAVHHRYVHLGSEQGWLVGGRITRINPEDRKRLTDYLSGTV